MKLAKIRAVEQLRRDFEDSKDFCGHIKKVKSGYVVSGLEEGDVIKCKDKVTAKIIANGEESKNMLLRLLIYAHDGRQVQGDGKADREK